MPWFSLCRSALAACLALAAFTACGDGDAGKQQPAAGPDRVTRPHSAVHVYRDPQGILHLYAAGRGDLFWTQGYETARDRMLQMDLLRRTALGTRAEVLGPKLAADDVAKRALGLGVIAKQNRAFLEQAHPQALDWLHSYAAGVNAWLADAQAGKVPRPGDLDAIEPGWWPAPWAPEDSLAVGKALVMSQNFQADTEVAVFALKLLMTPEKFADVFRFQPLKPTWILEDEFHAEFAAPKGAVTSAPVAALPAARERLAIAVPEAQRPLLGQVLGQAAHVLALTTGHHLGETGGSNGWAVGGSLTASGGAILCNDPHMPLDAPPRLHAVHLVDTSRTDTGAFGHTLPGVFFIVFGATEKLAWGITNSFADTTDLFQETPCDGGNGVQLGSACVPVEVRQEEVRVRPAGGRIADSAAQTYAVRRVPHHGPVLNDLLPATLAGPMQAMGLLISARWLGFDGQTSEAAALAQLLEADDVEAGKTALQGFDGGVVSWLLADAQGHVAYVAAGGWPQRATSADVHPPWDLLPGDGTAEWQGRLPFAQIPQVTDPKKGYIVSANHQIGPQGNDNDLRNDATYFGHFFDLGTRAWQISKRLEGFAQAGQLTLAQMAEIQTDDTAVLADVLLPPLVAAKDRICQDPQAAACHALALLETWDRQQAAGSAAAAVWGTLLAHVVAGTFGDDLPAPLVGLVGGYMGSIGGRTLRAWLTPGFVGPMHWDDGRTPETETAADILVRSLQQAVAQLQGFFPAGTPMTAWRWDAVHQVRFAHALPQLSHGPVGRDGGVRTVDAADYRMLDEKGGAPALPYLMTEGAVFRFCVELDPKGVSGHTGLAGGQGGDSASPWWLSQLDDWIGGQVRPIRWTRKAVEADAVEHRKHAP